MHEDEEMKNTEVEAKPKKASISSLFLAAARAEPKQHRPTVFQMTFPVTTELENAL